MPKLTAMPVLAFAASAALIAAATLSVSAEQAVTAPAPKIAAPANAGASETIVLAGGCFWGVQAVFQHVQGVERAVAGYAGGRTGRPTYEQVSTGATGYAEVVAVTFDPKTIPLGEILRIYVSVAHDPTELNRQGPDEGSQYRSEIFAADATEAKYARAYIAELDAAKVYPRPIVTKVETGAAFFPAEGYHQNYATLHPEQPYIAYYDLPKIENLKRLFPARYREKPALVAAL
ncbi:MAG: peptide-methionine (S)-S-oxide reductase MsrA [Pseudomonadota bacterium]|nr:peptide-methionine (S)-S-oxide reductase MsrA [Pseudomonadota bacterium]